MKTTFSPTFLTTFKNRTPATYTPFQEAKDTILFSGRNSDFDHSNKVANTLLELLKQNKFTVGKDETSQKQDGSVRQVYLLYQDKTVWLRIDHEFLNFHAASKEAAWKLAALIKTANSFQYDPAEPFTGARYQGVCVALYENSKTNFRRLNLDPHQKTAYMKEDFLPPPSIWKD